MEVEAQQDLRRQWVVYGLTALAAVLATISIGLRLADALPNDVPTLFGIFVSLLVAVLLGMALGLRRDVIARQPHRWLALCGAGMIAATLTACAWGGGWGLATWLALLVVAGTAVSLMQVTATLNGLSARAVAAVPVESSPQVSTTQCSSPLVDRGEPTSAVAAVPNDSLRMRLERRSSDGGETLDFEFHLDFAAGENQKFIHIPISPPLTGAPEVETEPLDDSEVEVQIAAVFPYGVRLDLRRADDADEPLHAVIGVRLVSPAAA